MTTVDIKDLLKLNLVEDSNIVYLKLDNGFYKTIKNNHSRRLLDVTIEVIRMSMSRYTHVTIIDSEGNLIEKNKDFTREREKKEYYSPDIPF